MKEVAEFRQHIIEAGVLDPEQVHHEFAYGGHGRKLDFEVISDDSEQYEEWIRLNVFSVQRRLGRTPLLAVLGVANGTNRLARDCSTQMGVEALYTEKLSAGNVELDDVSVEKLAAIRFGGGMVIALEDVGTTGGTAMTALQSARQAGAARVEGQFTWQRSPRLSAFAGTGISHHAIIKEPLRIYSPEECQTKGYCAKGWELIPRL